MKTALVSILLAATGACQAAVVGVVESPQGRIDLFDDHGQCVGKALKAEFIPEQGETVQGCWVVGGQVILVVFLDADIATIPVAMIAPPKAT
jgi:hypothetical protein